MGRAHNNGLPTELLRPIIGREQRPFDVDFDLSSRVLPGDVRFSKIHVGTKETRCQQSSAVLVEWPGTCSLFSMWSNDDKSRSQGQPSYILVIS
jgi:hypothetical protein